MANLHVPLACWLKAPAPLQPARLLSSSQEPGPGQSEAAEAGDDTTTRDSAGGGAVAGAPAGGAATSAERPGDGGGGGEDDELMKDVAALAGGAQGSDGIAQLEAALRPVERYAVRFVERQAPSVDKERLEAEVGAARALTGALTGMRRRFDRLRRAPRAGQRWSAPRRPKSSTHVGIEPGGVRHVGSSAPVKPRSNSGQMPPAPAGGAGVPGGGV